jgi:hypothetical protein
MIKKEDVVEERDSGGGGFLGDSSEICCLTICNQKAGRKAGICLNQLQTTTWLREKQIKNITEEGN